MANVNNGCKGFVKTQTTITVYFPIDWNGKAEVVCKHCPYLSSNERTCQLNKKPVYFPNSYLGEWCPLEQVETELKDNEEEKYGKENI